MKLVAADIGGTHARFAFATLEDGRRVALEEPATFRTSACPNFESAWRAFEERSGEPLPKALAIAFAGSVGGETFKLTNNAWAFTRDQLRQSLGIEQLAIVNDFAAVAHAVAELGPEHFDNLCGPGQPLPAEGVITVLGPGTGLGVAAVLRRGDGSYDVLDTEGGHIDFAPLDETEDAILRALRAKHGRVSVERLLSGRGLVDVYQALAALGDKEPEFDEEKSLWAAAFDGRHATASAALDRFCMVLGAVAGDLALAQGADAVVIGGGLGLRIADRLPNSGFRDRFVAKGRYRELMTRMPVKLITHSQPGLLGAAVSWGREHCW